MYNWFPAAQRGASVYIYIAHGYFEHFLFVKSDTKTRYPLPIDLGHVIASNRPREYLARNRVPILWTYGGTLMKILRVFLAAKVYENRFNVMHLNDKTDLLLKRYIHITNHVVYICILFILTMIQCIYFCIIRKINF